MIRALVMAALLPGAVYAQGPPAPVPEAAHDLDFGVVLSGVPRSIAPADSGAALWLFQGVAGTRVSLTFTSLPGFLSQGTQTLAVEFGPTSAAWSTTGDPETATLFDPSAGAVAELDESSDNLYVWLGGTAVPAPAHPAGDYMTTYTLDVSSLGP